MGTRADPPIWIWSVFLLLNGVALFCLLNPWLTGWRETAAIVLIAEAVLAILLCVPVFVYHLLWQGKTFRRSATDTVDTLLAALSGFA